MEIRERENQHDVYISFISLDSYLIAVCGLLLTIIEVIEIICEILNILVEKG